MKNETPYVLGPPARGSICAMIDLTEKSCKFDPHNKIQDIEKSYLFFSQKKLSLEIFQNLHITLQD